MTATAPLDRLRAWLVRYWQVPTLLGLILIWSVTAALYENFANRSVLIEAHTGVVRIHLTERMEGKYFENAAICLRRDRPNVLAKATNAACPETVFEMADPTGVATSVPACSEIELLSLGDRLELRILSVPEAYFGTDAGRLAGGKIVLEGDARRGFGQLAVFGVPTIGPPPVSWDTPMMSDGRYAINGRSFSQLFRDGGMLTTLKDGSLLAGAQVSFAGGDGQTPCDATGVEARTLISVAQDGRQGLVIAALSEHDRVDLEIRYLQADPIRIRPTLINYFLADPLLVLIFTLSGGILGLLNLFKLVK